MSKLNEKIIEAVAIVCATEAWLECGRGQTLDADDCPIIPTQPIGGDFDLLDKLLGREQCEQTREELELFECAFREHIEALLNSKP